MCVCVMVLRIELRTSHVWQVLYHWPTSLVLCVSMCVMYVHMCVGCTCVFKSPGHIVCFPLSLSILVVIFHVPNIVLYNYFCVYGYFVWMSVYHMNAMPLETRGWHQISWSWSFRWLWEAMFVGAGDQTQVLWKSHCCSPLSFLIDFEAWCFRTICLCPLPLGL